MYIRKLILLNPEQIKGLENIENEIKEKGGAISKAQLIRDSVQIFIDYFREDAINKYCASYKIRERAIERVNKTESD